MMNSYEFSLARKRVQHKDKNILFDGYLDDTHLSPSATAYDLINKILKTDSDNVRFQLLNKYVDFEQLHKQMQGNEDWEDFLFTVFHGEPVNPTEISISNVVQLAFFLGAILRENTDPLILRDILRLITEHRWGIETYNRNIFPGQYVLDDRFLVSLSRMI